MRGQFKSILILFILFLSTNIFAQVNEKKAAGELAYKMKRIISILDSSTDFKTKNDLFFFDGQPVNIDFDRLAKLKYLERCKSLNEKINALSPSGKKKLEKEVEIIKSFQVAFENYINSDVSELSSKKHQVCEVIYTVTSNKKVLKRCD